MSLRKRYYIFLVISPMLLFAVYKLTLSKTLKLKQDIQCLQHDIDRSSMAPMNIKILSNELKNLLLILDKKGCSKDKDLFTVVTNYCNNKRLTVRSYPQEHRIANAKHTCSTSIVCIEGCFIDLVKMIHVFERDKGYNIRSVSFKKYKDRISKTEKLQVKLYIQIIKNEK